MADGRRAGGMLAAISDLDTENTAVVVGGKALAQRASSMGFDRVLFFEVPDDAPVEAAASAIAGIASEENPWLVIGNDAPYTRIILGAISGAIGSTVLDSVQAISRKGDAIHVRRPIANGKAIEEATVSGPVASIYIGSDEDVPQKDACPIVQAALDSSSDTIVGTISTGETGLATAERIIGTGMGLKSRDDLAMIDALAETLRAETAYTLPICDSVHWCTADRVLGSSHNSAAPQLYIAIGISGSPNHLSGVRDSKIIVAINNDKDAEIFRRSNYGIVGDLYEVVPALTSIIKESSATA